MPKRPFPWGLQVIQQGVELGIPMGQRMMLRHQMENRFGDQVDRNVCRRIMDASPEQLARWSELVLSAGTLAEVLGD